MSKSSILNYHTYLKNSIKSGWITLSLILLILIPVATFSILMLFEMEIASLLMELFPPSQRQGIVFFQDLVYLARTEILWLGFFFLLTVILAAYPSQTALLNVLQVRNKTKGLYYMMLISFVFFIATLWVGKNTLEHFPNSSDEYAYLFQAEMFSRGKLWERAHDLPGFFYHNNIPQHDGILVSRFPPGWPLILSSSFEVGIAPHLLNPILGLVTLVVFYFFARRYFGESVAVWGLFILALSGFFIFNAASFFSHVSCALVTLLFVFNVYLYKEKNQFVYGILAGFFIGVVVVIRYYTAVLIFLPFLVYFLFQYRIGAIRLFLWMAVGGVPCLLYLFWYNYSITGNAFIPVTMWAYPNEQLGFVRGHTFMKGLQHVIRWILMFLYWASPGLLVLYLVFLWRKIKTPAQRLVHPEDYAFLTLIAGYFFYYEIGGNQYGPRFLFEALPFVVLFVVNKVLQTREKWAAAFLIASMLYPLIKLPFISYREEMTVDQRKDLYDLVEEKRITNAIVFIGAPTSPIRPMPVQDLTRNDPRFVNDVIYVVEKPAINHQVVDYYGSRSVYRYERDINSPQGELIRIR